MRKVHRPPRRAGWFRGTRSRYDCAVDLSLFAASAPGLEPLLAREVEAIAGAGTIVAGGVEARGDRTTLARMLVELGLASHVLVRVSSFHARDLERLEQHVARLPWSGWLRRGVPRRVRASTQRSRLAHTGAIAERVARAITERLGDAPDEAGEGGATEAISLLVRLVEDRVTISLDAAGTPLHRRGYRLDPHRAPLREDLARALVLASGWDRTSALVDPTCGSGTIAIEAALLASHRAPGLLRAFAFEQTPLDDGVALAAARDAARARVRPIAAPILARDRDPRAIEAARANAARAGVAADILFEVAPLGTARDAIAALGEERRGPAPRIVANPPWGERVGERGSLQPLYRALGALRRAIGGEARLAIAAHDRRLAYATGVPLGSAFLTDLGGLKVHAMTEREPGDEPPEPDPGGGSGARAAGGERRRHRVRRTPRGA